MIRVLNVVPTLNRTSGIMNYLINYSKNMQNVVTYDYLYFYDNSPLNFEKDIEAIGGITKKVDFNYFKNTIRNLIKVINESFLSDDIIYLHVPRFSKIFLKISKATGKKIILHAHNPVYSDNIIKNFVTKLMVMKSYKKMDLLLACSLESGKRLFKDEFNENNVINNFVDFEKYRFRENYRNELRKKYDVSEDTLVIGTIGRLVKQKNQISLFKLRKKYSKTNKNFKIFIVGRGNLFKKFKKKLPNDNSIVLVEGTNEPEKFYSFFDVFVLPSLYEGFGIVALEAQYSGLPTFVSKNVPKDIIISNLVFDYNINIDPYKNHDRKQIILNNHFLDFNEEKCTNKLIDLFKDILSK